MNKKLVSILLALMLVCVGAVGLADTYEDECPVYDYGVHNGDLVEGETCRYECSCGAVYYSHYYNEVTPGICEMCNEPCAHEFSGTARCVNCYYYVCPHEERDDDRSCRVCSCTIAFVTFNPNNGSEDPVVKKYVEKSSASYPLPEFTFTVPENSTFAGWLVDGVVKQPGGTFSLSGDLTITAQWKVEEYWFTYKASSNATTYYRVKNDGTSVHTVRSPEYYDMAPPDEGMVFDCWLLMVDGEVDSLWWPGEEIDAPGNFDFVANWAYAEECTVTMNLNGGQLYAWNEAIGGHELLNGWTYTVNKGGYDDLPPSSMLVAPEGKTFDYLKVNGTTAAPGTNYQVTGDTTVEVIWMDSDATRYTVSFDAGEGSGSMDSILAEDGVRFLVPGCKFTAPEGKIFDCWTYDGGTCQPGRSITVSADMTLVATWKVPAVYTVTFDANGGTGTMAAQEFTEGVEQALTKNSFEYKDAEFAGWLFNPEDPDDGILDDKEPIVAEEDMTLYAFWLTSVTFDPANGTEEEPLTTEFPVGMSIPLGSPENMFKFTTKENHTFAGWNDGTKTYKVGDPYIIAAGATLTAVWEKSIFTLTYDANGGKGEMDAQTFSKDVSQGLSANLFTRENYAFTGWNTAADGTGTAYDASATVTLTEDITLYAQWEQNIFTVTFDGNGGADEMEAQTFNKGEEQAISKNAFTYAGHTFAGWNTEEDGTGTPYTDGQFVTLSEDITLYAQWTINTYAITFATTEGATDSMDSETVTYGEYTLPNPTFTVTEGYTFSGWKIGEKTYQAGETINVESDLTLTAQWQKMTYTVTYDLNGGSSINTLGETVEHGGMHTLAGLEGITTPSGKLFDYWQVSGETEKKYPGNEIQITANTTVTAQWKDRTYTVTYYADKAMSSVYKTVPDLAYGTMHTVISGDGLKVPTEDQEFYAWNLMVNGEVMDEFKPGQELSMGADHKFAPVWIDKNLRTYTMSFDLGASTSTLEPITEREGMYFMLPSADDLTPPDGMEFDCWLVGETEYGEGDDLQAGGDVLELTAKAVWKPIQITIIYDSNGSPDSWEGEADDYGNAYSLRECTLTAPQEDMVFAGWKCGDTVYPEGYSFTLTEDKTFVAQWKHVYTLSYNANGGKGEMVNQTFIEDVPQGLSQNLFGNPGYTFNGWNTAADGTGMLYTDQQLVILTEDITLYAQWTPDDLAITFELGEFGGDDVTFTQKYGVAFKLPYVSDCGWSAYQDNYVFLGWNLNGKYYDQGAEATLYADTTYTAMWADRWYSFSFIDSFDGAKKGAATVEYGDKLTLPSPSKYGFEPHTEYHTFAYWSVGGKAYMPNETIPYSANKTIKAMWDFKPGIETITVETPVEIKEEMTQQQISAVVEQVFGETETKKLVEALNAKSSETITEPAQIVTEIEKAVPAEYEVETMTLQNVELMFKPEGSDEWIVATEENFPTTGITHTLAFNEGTSPATHDYLILHMLVEGDVGSIETITPEKIDADGVTGRFYSLSPVSLVAKAKPIEDTYVGDAMASLPETGDPSSLMGWITLLGASGIGLRAMKRRKK